jgi:hypothetical protein
MQSIANVILSINRAMVGEVSEYLMEARFICESPSIITIGFRFSREPDDNDLKSIYSITAEVNADFPETTVSHVVDVGTSLSPQEQGWRTVFARRELFEPFSKPSGYKA